ncbi:Phospholipase/carboxylesterase/thioesterase [Pilobolus umbonatus]|nr:Phospholipase/carboxylesterase/thioesterase [Pilobolus umbonatus]
MSSPAYVIAAKAKQTATVLWFHGLGDTGAGWSFLADELSTLFPYIKWILPNAPVRPITLNGGYPMPAWFDLTSLSDSLDRVEDEKGMLESIVIANRFIRQEVDSGIPANRIVVGGFSQGCALSLLTGLTSEYKLGGIIGCSGWLFTANKFPALGSDANKKTPILMCHGEADATVNTAYGRKSYDKLKSLGYNINFITYPGLAHSANEKEISDIAQFIAKTIPANV